MDQTEIKHLLETHFPAMAIQQIDSHSVLKNRRLAFGYKTVFQIDQTTCEVFIGFDRRFPYQSPSYFLLNTGQLPPLPHVDTDGLICYTHTEHVFLETLDPEGIILQSFQMVIDILEKGIRKENEADFVEEFEDYWSRLNGIERVVTNFFDSDQLQEIDIIYKNQNACAGAASASSLARDQLLRMAGSLSRTWQKGLLIPIQSLDPFVSLFTQPLSLAQIHTLIWDNLLSADKDKLLGLLQRKIKAHEYIFLSCKQSKDRVAIFGFHFSKIVGETHPLTLPTTRCKISPLSVERVDAQSLVSRGGGHLDLQKRKGLVIGCGAVGGYVIEELVRSGILQLTVVDPDTLKPENMYRHISGAAYVGKNKAKALKEKVEHYYPHSQIEALGKSIEEVLEAGKIKSSSYDFVVIATGNATLNIYLNRFFAENKWIIPLFYCWIDPYGIGGHCLAINPSQTGCYQCLYTDSELHNRASFAEQEKEQPRPFSKSLSGCGTVFTPYGSLDACQTALLTVRKVVNCLESGSLENRIHSWKGNATSFLKEGYVLSNRYKQSDQELYQNGNGFYHSQCPICVQVSTRISSAA